jgi:carboxyl-terminal processing protease
MRSARLAVRTVGRLLAWLVLVALSAPQAARPAELSDALLGIDPSFAPLFDRRPYGVVLQRTRHLDAETLRLALVEPSIAGNSALGDGRRLVRLDRFGRHVDEELSGALRGTHDLVLDLRHNQGGLVRRMLRVAARFTGPVPRALELVADEGVTVLAIPPPSGAVWRGRLTVLVGPLTISSGEVLAALLRRHAGAAVLGERTFGKDYVLRVERLGHGWQALIPDGRIVVPGEDLKGGLRPDGPIPQPLAASLPTH